MDGGHVFIDESKRSGYLIVAATVSPASVEVARRSLRALLLPGQNALHFKKEKDGRRRFLLGQMARLEVEARVYLRRAGNAVDARRACLEAAVFDEPTAARFVLWTWRRGTAPLTGARCSRPGRSAAGTSPTT